jgi:DNA polymerase I-like protein with 3'-5' exonuclease and polymerase domains
VSNTRPVTIDFETDPIEPRPRYPPRPVGVSIKYPGKPARYHGFGHVDCAHCGALARNNCTEGEAKAALRAAYRWPELLFQNGKFDLDVAETYWDLKAPSWERIQDTLFAIFLDDPNQQTFSLKPAAERLLKMKPEEKDEVCDWLLEHQPVKGVRISKAPRSDNYFMKFLRYAPAPLVGRYADGDVIRTELIFDLLMPRIEERGMRAAYDRERRLMPILLEMERRGVPVNLRRLRKDVQEYGRVLERANVWLRARVRASDDVNLDSGEQLFECMRKAKLVDVKRAPLTATGKYQTNKAALAVAVKDPKLSAMLRYRTQLKTTLGTFMGPWMTTASAAESTASAAQRKLGHSLVFTSWNQVRGDARGGQVGARTGRLSASLLMNTPKTFTPIFKHEARDAAERKKLPPCPIRGLPPLPKVRSYIVPFPGEMILDRDFNQQEPRILAHFDGGEFMQMYLDDPWMDFHTGVQRELAKAGLHYERKYVKAVSLGTMYGQGAGLLAERLGIPVEEAKKLKAAIMRILVGLKEMYRDCRVRAIEGRPITTWGGRQYFCEPPRIVDGRFRTFDYKLPNALIQGSAADATKEAIIRYHASKPTRHKLLLTVHDQLTASAPKAEVAKGMESMREAMEGLEFDVKLLSTGSTSEANWASLEDYDVRGERV